MYPYYYNHPYSQQNYVSPVSYQDEYYYYDDRQHGGGFQLPPGHGPGSGPPVGPPPGHGPGSGPPMGPPPGQGHDHGNDHGLTSGPPTAPPPSHVPQQQASAFAVDPGGIARCMFRYTYVWLRGRQQFWFYPIFVGRTSVAGYRWTGRRWTYFGISLRQIQSFTCV